MPIYERMLDHANNHFVASSCGRNGTSLTQIENLVTIDRSSAAGNYLSIKFRPSGMSTMEPSCRICVKMKSQSLLSSSHRSANSNARRARNNSFVIAIIDGDRTNEIKSDAH